MAHALLLAAFPPELAGLDLAPPTDWRVACTGVGALAAAITTTRLIAEARPDRVVFIGTCGAYDSRLGIGDLITVSRVLVTSLDEQEGRAYRPGPERTAWDAVPLPGLPAHTVAIPPAITQTQAGAQRLAAIAPAEHLELSGVFAACEQAGIPASAALAVANRVGPDAHPEWSANHAACSQALVKALRERGVFEPSGMSRMDQA